MYFMRFCSLWVVIGVCVFFFVVSIFLPFPSEQCISNKETGAEACGIYQTFDYLAPRFLSIHIDWVAFCNVCVTAAIAAFTWNLAVSTKQLWEETKKTAEAAKTSADFLKAAERPWVLVTTITMIDIFDVKEVSVTQPHVVPADPRIKFDVINAGRSPALLTALSAKFHIVANDESLADVWLFEEADIYGYQAPLLVKDSFPEEVRLQGGALTPPKRQQIVSGETFLVFRVKIEYFDVFGDRHESIKCLRHDGKRDWVVHGGKQYNHNS